MRGRRGCLQRLDKALAFQLPWLMRLQLDDVDRAKRGPRRSGFE